MTAVSDPQRLYLYVEGFFARHQRTEWPTVAHAARSLGWRQDRVEAAVEGDPETRLFFSSYLTDPEPRLGEHYIETNT